MGTNKTESYKSKYHQWTRFQKMGTEEKLQASVNPVGQCNQIYIITSIYLYQDSLDEFLAQAHTTFSTDKMKYITVLQSSNSLHPMFVWSPSFRRFKLFAWCWDLSEYVFCRKKNFNYKPLQMNSSMKLSEPKVSNFHQILNMQLFKKNNYFLVDWNFH